MVARLDRSRASDSCSRDYFQNSRSVYVGDVVGNCFLLRLVLVARISDDSLRPCSHAAGLRPCTLTRPGWLNISCGGMCLNLVIGFTIWEACNFARAAFLGIT